MPGFTCQIRASVCMDALYVCGAHDIHPHGVQGTAPPARRTSMSFVRSFRLPPDADLQTEQGAASASVKHGMLRLGTACCMYKHPVLCAVHTTPPTPPPPIGHSKNLHFLLPQTINNLHQEQQQQQPMHLKYPALNSISDLDACRDAQGSRSWKVYHKRNSSDVE